MNEGIKDSVKRTLRRGFEELTYSQAQERDLEDHLFFSELSNIERRDILPKLSVETYAAGAQIIGADESNTDVFFILSGEAEISLETGSGQQIFFETIQGGEYFGEFAAIDGDPRSAQVVASLDCRIIRMNRTTFLSLLLTHPKLALRMMERLVAIIRNGNRKIVDISTLTVVERLYNYLIENGESSGSDTVLVRRTLHQTRLGAELGVTRETISRAMNKLLTDQTVVRGEKGIYVRTNVSIKR